MCLEGVIRHNTNNELIYLLNSTLQPVFVTQLNNTNNICPGRCITYFPYKPKGLALLI